MKEQTSAPIHINDWIKDELRLHYPERLDGWGICHLGDDRVSNTQLHMYSYL